MPSPAKPTPPKPRLGRGLSSLIVNSAQAPDGSPEYQSAPAAPDVGKAAIDLPPGAGVLDIPLDQIAPNPFQPRRNFDETELAGLAQSIARQGLLQPLVVAKADDPAADRPYVVVVGERRCRAARQAGLTAVPCVLRSATRQEMLEWALVENIHRADLNPMERAHAYREYMDRFGLSQVDAADRLGEARTTVANFVRMLDLPDEVQQLLMAGAISFGHAKVLAGCPDDPQRQVGLARRCEKDGLSVRELEGLLAAGPGGGAPRRRAAGPDRPRPAYLRDFEEQLTRAVGTRVLIRPGRAKNAGRIVIDYYGLDDFDRIVSCLGAKLES